MKYSKKEIEKNNRLIAEFMGWKEKESGYYPISVIKIVDEYQIDDDCENYHGQYVGDLPLKVYHISWDWLMPVVDKIENIFKTKGFLQKFEINSHFVSLRMPVGPIIKVGCYKTSTEKIKFNSKIEAVYCVVVEFIKYYNNYYSIVKF